jgi:glycosyltransferase involved in cell wall biosynthesis
MTRKKIAVFYYVIVDDNAIGRCNRIVLEKLCEKYDFTVFAVQFDNPRPDRIDWVRVRSVQRPMFLLYLTYRITAWFAHAWHRLVMRQFFDLTVASDGCVDFARLAHVHFCNRLYWTRFLRLRELLSMRGFSSAMDHLLRSLWEGRLFRRVERIVVPSDGLRQELIDIYGVHQNNVSVIANPVDLTKYSPIPEDKERLRSKLGLQAADLVCVFLALGHFERKGLGPLLDALADSQMASVRLLAVGGSYSATSIYRQRAKELGIEDRVIFCGHQSDTRPFLWAADVFVLPSRYETFSLVAVEAAACGLPVITTELHGVVDWARAGVTGYVLREPTAAAVVDGLRMFMRLSRAEQEKLGENARRAVLRYGTDQYVEAFDLLYSQALQGAGSLSAKLDSKVQKA